jgi:hypothetical protein
MVELEQQSSDDSDDVPKTAGGRRRWQWNLKTLLLLMAAIATWTAYICTTRLNQHLRSEVGTLRDLAGELVVTNAKQFAIVNSPDQWFDDFRWDVYLPPGSQYVIKLGTRELDETGIPEATQEVQLSPGRYQVHLEQVQRDNYCEINVEVDGHVVISDRESRTWSGFLIGLGDYTHTQQFPTSKPLGLQQSRALVRLARPLPNVRILWIETDQR